MATKSSKQKPLKVVELFAGVGGFRIGLDRAGNFETIWANQWEPSTKKQHAWEVYEKCFGESTCINEDIATVDAKDIPQHDVLVGGFPCQDYSVARTLSHAEGLRGKKGVLWWEIHRIVEHRKPKYVFLENVDRLLKSPASQRGRDFAIMLATLSDLGYHVEWRVINAADYGMPQRRRRVFIMGYRNGSPIHKKFKRHEPIDWLHSKGVLADAFPIEPVQNDLLLPFEIKGDAADITELFNSAKQNAKSPFENAGLVAGRQVWTRKVTAKHQGKQSTLLEHILDEKDVPDEYFIPKKDLARWKYLKGSKKEMRTTKDGFTYEYTEGGMTFPDALDKPSRTIVTGEGGPTPSRFKHVIKTKGGKLRRLTPLELERLCMFPDNHTAGVTDSRRAFFMGNALVVGIIERIGKSLATAHHN